MISEFEDFITSKLLMSHPHNYSAALRRAEKPIAPRDVRRAIDYMQAKLARRSASPTSQRRPASPGARCSSTSRTITASRRCGTCATPVSRRRATRCRRAQPEESITEIAMAWGFSHMGRFSVEYRRRFGERPSEHSPTCHAPFMSLVTFNSLWTSHLRTAQSSKRRNRGRSAGGKWRMVRRERA